MKTLVLHPWDSTTRFLEVIYKGKGFTEVRARPSNSKMKRLIKSHDRIIVLGHGTEKGMFDTNSVIWIDSRLVYLLREKKNSVYIWCNADLFVEKYKLDGFYTGMIVSDYEEAQIYGVSHKRDDIDISNELFAKSIGDGLDSDIEIMLESVIGVYSDPKNKIIEFNKKNIHKSI